MSAALLDKVRVALIETTSATACCMASSEVIRAARERMNLPNLNEETEWFMIRSHLDIATDLTAVSALGLMLLILSVALARACPLN